MLSFGGEGRAPSPVFQAVVELLRTVELISQTLSQKAIRSDAKYVPKPQNQRLKSLHEPLVLVQLLELRATQLELEVNAVVESLNVDDEPKCHGWWSHPYA